MSPTELRNKLASDLKRLRREEVMQRGEVSRFTMLSTQTERAYKEALVEDYRSGAEEGSAGEARLHVINTAESLKLAEDRAEAAAKARKQTETELVHLYVEHFDVFAAELDEPKEAAIEAMLEAEEPLRRAHTKWMRATEAWAPLTPAIRERVRESLLERGIHPNPQHVEALARVPEFPLPIKFEVFESVRRGSLAPRPGALVPTPEPGEIADASEEAI